MDVTCYQCKYSRTNIRIPLCVMHALAAVCHIFCMCKHVRACVLVCMSVPIYMRSCSIVSAVYAYFCTRIHACI